MFTIDQINASYKRVKSGADFPKLIQNLKLIGVTHYSQNVADGRTTFFGLNNYFVEGEVKYRVIEVNHIGSSHKLKHALSIHQQGLTDYLTFCKHAAEAGVEKWTTDIVDMTVTYFDREKKTLIVEKIPTR